MLTRIIRLLWKGCNHSRLCPVLGYYYGVWTITHRTKSALVTRVYGAKKITFKAYQEVKFAIGGCLRPLLHRVQCKGNRLW